MKKKNVVLSLSNPVTMFFSPRHGVKPSSHLDIPSSGQVVTPILSPRYLDRHSVESYHPLIFPSRQLVTSLPRYPVTPSSRLPIISSKRQAVIASSRQTEPVISSQHHLVISSSDPHIPSLRHSVTPSVLRPITSSSKVRTLYINRNNVGHQHPDHPDHPLLSDFSSPL